MSLCDTKFSIITHRRQEVFTEILEKMIRDILSERHNQTKSASKAPDEEIDEDGAVKLVETCK